MKRITRILAAAFAVAALSACSLTQEDASSPREIQFTVSMGTFATRATDTAFETGDKIGVTVGDFYANVPLTWNGSSLAAQATLYWPETVKGSDIVKVQAYYPYIATEDKKEYLTVNADQSTHALYSASDYMTCETAVRPDEGPVVLNFVHAFCRIILNIQTTYNIKSVYVAGVQGRAEIFPNGSEIYAIGSEGMIKTGKVTLADGTTAWSCIIPPQFSFDYVLIVTDQGKKYVYMLYADDDYNGFNGGFSYKATMVVDENAAAIDLDWEESDWSSDNDVQFGQETNEGGIDSNL